MPNLRPHPYPSSPALIFILVLAGFSSSADAQLEPEWVAGLPIGTSLSAGFRDMAVTEDGRSFVTSIHGWSSNTDILTAAYAPDGTLLWSESFNGPGDWHDQSHGIALSSDGSVWVCGSTPGTNRYADVLLLQYDATNGDLVSAVQYTSASGRSESARHVVTDAAANVYVAGSTVGDGADVHVLAFDLVGKLLWRTTWDGPAAAPYSQDSAQQIALDADGNVLVLIHGVTHSLHPDYIVAKYDANDGTLLWQARHGVSGGDFPREMVIDAAGDVYVTGTGIDSIDKFLTVKFDGSTGGLLWREYDAVGFDSGAAGIALDPNGDVIVCGSVDRDGNRSNANDNIYVVKRDAVSGALLWTFEYGETCVGCFDTSADVRVDSAGNVLVVGASSSPPYSNDLILFRLDASTGLEIERGATSGNDLETLGASTLQFDAHENLYAAGQGYHVNTGEKRAVVLRYTSLTEPYTFTRPELRAGQIATLSLTGATPFERQYFVASTQGTGVTPVPELGIALGIVQPRLLVFGRSDVDGNFARDVSIPTRAAGRTVWLQAAQLQRVSEVHEVTVLDATP